VRWDGAAAVSQHKEAGFAAKKKKEWRGETGSGYSQRMPVRAWDLFESYKGPVPL
jgi:hypothetical protein